MTATLNDDTDVCAVCHRQAARWYGECWDCSGRDDRPPHLRLTPNTLGTAAYKILTDDATITRIDEVIADCAWCQKRRSNRECWHQAAKVLLDHGLHARTPTNHTGDDSDFRHLRVAEICCPQLQLAIEGESTQ